MEAVHAEFHRDDARLVARAQAGDQAAFRQLFETYSPLVFRIAARMLGDDHDAADLTQEIFVRIYQKIGALRDGQAFHAWITRMAVNMLNDHLRRRHPTTFSLNAAPPGADDDTEWQLPSEGLGAEERILSGELQGKIQAALQALSHDHRSVVVLHHLENMPIEEIATILKIPPGTVKSRLARARAELKRRLEDYLTG
jgi:RNA polymerase sigma-70 factor (ECF subfamily)